jgi:hypothetical protein
VEVIARVVQTASAIRRPASHAQQCTRAVLQRRGEAALNERTLLPPTCNCATKPVPPIPRVTACPRCVSWVATGSEVLYSTRAQSGWLGSVTHADLSRAVKGLESAAKRLLEMFPFRHDQGFSRDDVNIWIEVNHPRRRRPSHLQVTFLLARDILPVCAPEVPPRLNRTGDLLRVVLLHHTKFPENGARWASLAGLRNKPKFGHDRQTFAVPTCANCCCAMSGCAWWSMPARMATVISAARLNEKTWLKRCVCMLCPDAVEDLMSESSGW